MKGKILTISVLWKNDLPDGVAVTFTWEMGNLNGMLEEITKSYDELWREAVFEDSTATLVEGLLSQLRAIGQEKVATRKVEFDMGFGSWQRLHLREVRKDKA